MDYEKKELYFPCSGEKCHGILYFPSNIKKTPALIMGMGFGMIKEVHADDYAPYFAQKGISVLVFDYRRFGKSEGKPRQALYPMDQVSDYRCAISYMKTLDIIDPDKICVWGTSFSGGHVLTLLAFPELGLRCGISQVPNAYSYRTALEYFGSLEPVLMISSQNSKECCEGNPSYIPIVSKDGIAALMSKEAFEYYSNVAWPPPSPEERECPEVLRVNTPFMGATLLCSTMKDRGFFIDDNTLPVAFFNMFKAPFKSEWSLCFNEAYSICRLFIFQKK